MSAPDTSPVRAYVVTTLVIAVAVLALGASAIGAQSFDGSYAGTFSGTSSGTVEFSVSGSEVTVTQPGSGSGSVSGSSISTVVGNATVSGSSCQYESSGELSISASGDAVATGTWNASCTGGQTGNGTWEATRPAPAASASPSPTVSPGGELMLRTLSLRARPKRLSAPGRTTLTAVSSDCTQGSTIDFEQRRKGEFQTIGSLQANTECKASVTRRITKRTSFRALSPSDGVFVATESRTITVKVDR